MSDIDDVKADADCLEEVLMELAAIWGMFGILTSNPVADAAAVGFGYAAWEMAEIEEDPPQPSYKEKVKLETRPIKLPPLISARDKKIGRLIKLTVKGSVLTTALLNAMERCQGASHARDTKYAPIQKKAMHDFRKKLLKNMADISSSLISTAKSIKGSDLDIKMAHAQLERIQKKVSRSGFPSLFREAMDLFNMERTDRMRFKKLIVGFYRKRIIPTNLSSLLELYAKKIINLKKG